MISNARDTKLGEQTGGLPNVSSAMLSWFQPMTLVVLTKQILNLRNVDTEDRIKTRGVIQPFSDDQLKLMESGERNWAWHKLHVEPGVELKPSDHILYLGLRYKVMSRRDYRQYGYLEYNLIEDFRNA